MPTKFRKPVSRRIGDLVATIEPTGLRLRRHRRRRSILLPWDELGRALLSPKTAAEAFASPAPRGWLPRPGDRVWVRPRPHTVSNIVPHGEVVKIMEALPEAIAIVRINYAGRIYPLQVLRSNLRPLGPTIDKVS